MTAPDCCRVSRPENSLLPFARGHSSRRGQESRHSAGTGEWLAFLDQDDVWLPRKLEMQMALAATGVGIVYGRAVHVRFPTGNVRDYDYAHEFTALPEGDIFTQLFADGCFIAMSSAVLRRSAVEELAAIPGPSRSPRLLPLPGDRSPLSGARCAGCRLPLSPASGSMSRSHRLRLFRGAAVAYRSVGRQPRSQAGCLSPDDLLHRLALEEMRSRKTFCPRPARLWSQGSVLWLCSRPVQAFRALRRKLRQPYWIKRQTSAEG